MCSGVHECLIWHSEFGELECFAEYTEFSLLLSIHELNLTH